ncbi:GntR family transcriptional regulator [Tateyamaria sp. SN3-11]|uniref:GntR family transcriptional regulator n=1 Tax=Tateyamaria sp. SN3-11 TaxID=3092147 RepID=UPI0039EC8172
MPDVDVTKLPILDDMNGPLADRAYTALKSAIMAMDFAPGAFIRKSALCDRLGLSRSPVTDALAKLSVEGLVDIVPQSGTRVARLSMAAVREDVFLRETLEVAAARYAAEHRTDDVLARLSRNIEMQKLLVVDGDVDEFMRTDIAFHETIMATTNVSRLPGVVRTVSPSVNRARKLLMPEPGRMADTVEEHVQVANAIRRQDAKAAEDAMRYHVRQLLRRLEPLEAARPDLFSK